MRHRRIGRRVFVGAGIMLAATPAFGAEPPSDVTAVEDFDELWRTLGERYCYFSEKTTDWQKVRSVYRPLAMAARTDEEFVGVIHDVLAELYDAHTHLSSPSPGAPRWPGYDMIVERAGDVARIVAVEDGSAPAFVGLRPGDQILAVDQVPVAAAAAKRMPRCLARPDPAAEWYAWNVAVGGLTERPRVLTIRRAENKTTLSSSLPVVPKVPEAAVSSTTLDDGFGYIRIGTFADRAVSADFDNALARLRETRGLVIDVRRNGGGDTAVARPVMGRFISDRKPYARMRRRSGSGLGDAWTEYVDPRGPFTYTRPVVVLVDRWSGSMAEGFPMGMRGLGRARIVGTRMAGLGAGVFGLRLDRTGVQAQYSAEPVYDIWNAPRTSLRPDVPVEEGADILRAGVKELRRLVEG